MVVMASPPTAGVCSTFHEISELLTRGASSISHHHPKQPGFEGVRSRNPTNIATRATRPTAKALVKLSYLVLLLVITDNSTHETVLEKKRWAQKV